jgi:hypothetical protein
MVTIRRNLLTPLWTEDVRTLASTVARFTVDRPQLNACRVTFFEIAGDGHLHVNVMHRHQTMSPRGWDGPGRVPEGFVHNRRFAEAPPDQLARHIRDMVFADRID